MKKAFNWLRGHWAKFVSLLFADTSQRSENQSDTFTEAMQDPPLGKLYYGNTIKVYTAYISKGRIIKPDDRQLMHFRTTSKPD